MIGYRRSSNKLIVSTSWLSMCYSSKSSAGTWLLHFNSSLAKLRIYYSMCWLRSEKMNWLLIRVALRGHRGETTHSLVISFNRAPFSDWDSRDSIAKHPPPHRIQRKWLHPTRPPPPRFGAKDGEGGFEHGVAIRCLDGRWERGRKRADGLRAARPPRGSLTKASRPERLN